MDHECEWVRKRHLGAVATVCSICGHTVDNYVRDADARLELETARRKTLETAGNAMKKALRFLSWGGCDEVVEWCQLTGQPYPGAAPKASYSELEAQRDELKRAGDAMVGAMNRAGLGGVEGVHGYVVEWCRLTGQLHQARAGMGDYGALKNAGDELVLSLTANMSSGFVGQAVEKWRELTGQVREPAADVKGHECKYTRGVFSEKGNRFSLICEFCGSKMPGAEPEWAGVDDQLKRAGDAMLEELKRTFIRGRGGEWESEAMTEWCRLTGQLPEQEALDWSLHNERVKQPQRDKLVELLIEIYTRSVRPGEVVSRLKALE